MMLNHKSPPLISRAFEFQNHCRRLRALVAEEACDRWRVLFRYQLMGMPGTTGKRHAQKTSCEDFCDRRHATSLLLQHEANGCRGFAREGHQGNHFAVVNLETAFGLQLLARRFQFDFLFICTDEDGQFGVGF